MQVHLLLIISLLFLLILLSYMFLCKYLLLFLFGSFYFFLLTISLKGSEKIISNFCERKNINNITILKNKIGYILYSFLIFLITLIYILSIKFRLFIYINNIYMYFLEEITERKPLYLYLIIIIIILFISTVLVWIDIFNKKYKNGKYSLFSVFLGSFITISLLFSIIMYTTGWNIYYIFVLEIISQITILVEIFSFFINSDLSLLDTLEKQIFPSFDINKIIHKWYNLKNYINIKLLKINIIMKNDILHDNKLNSYYRSYKTNNIKYNKFFIRGRNSNIIIRGIQFIIDLILTLKLKIYHSSFFNTIKLRNINNINWKYIFSVIPAINIDNNNDTNNITFSNVNMNNSSLNITNYSRNNVRNITYINQNNINIINRFNVTQIYSTNPYNVNRDVDLFLKNDDINVKRECLARLSSSELFNYYVYDPFKNHNNDNDNGVIDKDMVVLYENNVSKYLDSWVFINDNRKLSKSIIIEKINTYLSLSEDKGVALKRVFSYIHGFQANELTEAFASLCDHYNSYHTMHELFHKNEDGSLYYYSDTIKLLRYNFEEKDFILDKQEFIRKENRSKEGHYPFNLIKLHKDLIRLSFIFSKENMIFSEENMKGRYTMRIVSIFNLFIRDKEMKIFENGQFLDSGFIKSGDRLTCELEKLDKDLNKLCFNLRNNRMHRWVFLNLEDKNVISQELKTLIRDFKILLKLRAEFINLSVFGNFDINQMPDKLDKYLEKWWVSEDGIIKMRQRVKRENVDYLINKCSLSDQNKIRSIIDKNVFKK